MELCPQCKNENPSIANYCMNCGEALSPQNPNKTTPLKTRLNNANDTITQLKKSLKTQKHEKLKADKKIEELQAKIKKQEQEIKSAKEQLSENKKHVAGENNSIEDIKKYIPIIILLFLILLTVVLIIKYFEI